MHWGWQIPSGYYCTLRADILTSWKEEPHMVPLVQLLACTVMLSAMLLLLPSGASSSKMANGLLLDECCWWTDCKSQMFAGAVGSCNVVGVLIGVLVSGGAIEHALACVILGDGPSVSTLGSGVASDRGRSTLGNGISVAIGFDVPRWRTGGEGYHVVFEWLALMPQKHWWKFGQCRQGQWGCPLLLVLCTLLVTVLCWRSALDVRATC